MNLIDLPKDSGKPLPSTAISYLRFSGIRQAKGDSTRRQNSSAAKFTEVTGIEIAERLEDLGLSAWSGKHVSQGALGEFLKQIQTEEFQTKVKSRDVFLVVENLDRLSREAIDDAFVQFRDIVRAGVKVVTMMDQKIFDATSIKDMATVIMSIVTMARAHEESQDKSRRLCDKWKELRRKAEAGEIVSKRLPAWLKTSEDGKRIETIPECVKIVRRIFSLFSKGVSMAIISATLNKEGIPTITKIAGRRKMKNAHTCWFPSTINHILQSKAVIGIKVMRKNGEVALEVPDYYPAIIKPEQRASVLKYLSKRPSQRGRTSQSNVTSNLLRKLAFDEVTGEPIYSVSSSGKYHHLVPKGIHCGNRQGARWKRSEFEGLFFLTIQRALQVEGSTQKDEDALALVEVELEKIGKASGNLMTAIQHLGDRKITAITDELAKLDDREKELIMEKEGLKDAILAGAGSLQLDPNETDRQKLAQTIQVNVERIEMNCEKERFTVKLMNGISYRVTWNEEEGQIVLISKDFKPEKTILEWNPKMIGKKAQTEMVRTLQKPLKKA